MPRVLFVSYSGVLGGAERVLLDWAPSTPGAPALACPPGPLADGARAAGMAVLTLPVRPLRLRGGRRARWRAVAALAGHAAELRRLERDLDPDLIVVWGMRSALAAVALAGRCPWLFAHHDLLPGWPIGWAVRRCAARAGAVVVPSATVAGDLDPSERLGQCLQVLSPGVELDRCARATATAPAQPPEVLVIGAIVPWKRPELALEAVALARRRVPQLRLRLLGAPLDEPGRRLLESLRRRAGAGDLAGAVSFAGFDPDPAAALTAATCLLHCAPREPFGLAVLEALAAGRPAVVCAAGGPAEIVDDSCGIRYPPGDAAAAADALVQIATDPERARTLGRAGRRRAADRFAPAAARSRFGQLVQAVARRPGSGPGAAPDAGAPGAPAAPALAIVTVTRNCAGELAALLDSVARHLPGAEVVVVDCASVDASVAVARDREWVTTIALEDNVGFGRATNRGLAAARAPVTALLNPDVELLDDSLAALAAEAIRPDRPERLLAPRVLNGDGSLQDTVHPLPGSAPDVVAALLPPALVPGRAGVALAPWRSDVPRRVGWAVGCAVVARTATLRALGPFPEATFMYGEDLELGLHARGRGIETWLWPAARVLHHGARSAAPEFGGEPFARLARGRHAAVARQLGPRRAALDDAVQMATFASRLALKRALGRRAARECRQLAAVASVAAVRGAGEP